MSRGRRRSSDRSGIFDVAALYVVRIVVGAMYLLPAGLSLWIARFCILLVLIFMPRSLKVGMRNLELIFPELPVAERRRILFRSLDVLARNILSYAKIPTLTKERAAAIIDYDDARALIERVRNENPGVGVIVATLHFGSFEQIIQINALLDRPMAILARGFGLPRLDRWWNDRRELFGNRVFFRKGGYAEIVRELSSGTSVSILFDQNVKVNHATFVDFFGIPAATTKGLGYASQRTGAPVIFAVNYQTGPARYTIVAEEVRVSYPEDSSPEERVNLLMRELHRLSEREIRRHPEQWFWIHRRFKTRPAGEPETMYS